MKKVFFIIVISLLVIVTGCNNEKETVSQTDTNNSNQSANENSKEILISDESENAKDSAETDAEKSDDEPELSAIVSIPDDMLQFVIRQQLEKPDGDILVEDMLKLTTISAGEGMDSYIVEDLTGIQYAKNLERFYCYGCKISNLQPLYELEKLQVLDLDDNGLDNSMIGGLSELKSLTELHLDRNPITDIKVLSHLKNLEWLSVGFINMEDSGTVITDFRPLAKLVKLKELQLHANEIKNIDFLQGLQNLTMLNLNGNQIANIEPLANLTKLQELSISGNQIVNIHPLTELHELKNVGLSENNITDITPLSGLTKISRLQIRNNSISNIEPLKDLQDLESLLIDNNQISNLGMVVNFKKLNEFSVGDNPLDANSINLVNQLKNNGVYVY
ncbi:leucine-rich repeat domain-containing protein [Calidifontibacillus oryziterrae]|uniref:leucine-rich repeat domain-containing protein n=1 Tax=Calidifontibacillus oryziterrae TaxID=1191699 RepID=UPI0002DC12D4|nr:leucine-rich repeat domain-containing protein [Calidifontibacillus oryziterrae]